MQKLYITFDYLRQNEQTGAHGCQNGVQPRHHGEVDGPASAKTLWHVIKHKHTHHERTITHDLRSLFRYFQKRNIIIQTRKTRRIAGIGPELTKITRNSHFNLLYSIPHHITGQAQSFHVLRCRRKNRWYRRAIMWHRIEDTATRWLTADEFTEQHSKPLVSHLTSSRPRRRPCELPVFHRTRREQRNSKIERP